MKYIYKTIRIDASYGVFSGTDFNDEKYTEILNTNGNDGWKLVSVNSIEKVKGGTKCVIATLIKEIP